MQAVADIAINEEKSNGIIDQYKKGNLTTEEFRNKINKLIESSDGKAITDNKIFDNCWNSMCIVEPENLTKLYNLQEKHNLHIHVIGGTNELQHNYIQEKIQQAPDKPDISYTLSYVLHTLDSELLKNAAETTLKQQNYETIIWHVEQQRNYEQNALELLGKAYDGEMS